MDRIELELYLNNLLETGAVQGLLPERSASRRAPQDRQTRDRRRPRQLAFLEARARVGRRRRAGPSRLLLAQRGAADHRPQVPGACKLLLANDLNLFAYHLPLDAASRVRQQRADRCEDGLDQRRRVSASTTSAGSPRLRCRSRSRTSGPTVEQALGRTPLVFGDPDRESAPRGVVHGRRAGHFSTTAISSRRRRLSERARCRSQIMHIVGGERRSVSRGRPSCDRALRRAGGRASICRSSSTSSISLSIFR